MSCLSKYNISASLEGPVQFKIWYHASLTVTADSTLSSKEAPAVASKRHAHAAWACCTGCLLYLEIKSRWLPFTGTGVTAWSNVYPRPMPSKWALKYKRHIAASFSFLGNLGTCRFLPPQKTFAVLALCLALGPACPSARVPAYQSS